MQNGKHVILYIDDDQDFLDTMRVILEAHDYVMVVRELKAIGSTVPVLMLSSVGDNLSMTTDYTGLGLAGLFQKPIDPDTLITVLKMKLKPPGV
jgi:FixJ family two-component response regulator